MVSEQVSVLISGARVHISHFEGKRGNAAQMGSVIMDTDENRAWEQGNTFKESLAAEVEADTDEHDCCILFTEQSCSCLLLLL